MNINMMTRFFLALMGCQLLLTGCKQEADPTLRNGLIYCMESAPTSMNPQLYTTGSMGSTLSQQVYDRLLTLNPLTQRIEGALASDWSVSADGMTYSFTLRPNVAFHTRPWFTPTRPMNADDVVFSFKRMLNSQHPFHHVSGGSYPFFDNTDFQEQVRDIRRVDESHIEFQLTAPNASFLSYLASDYAVILSAEYAGKMMLAGRPQLLDLQAIGTGPFMQQEFRSGEFVRLVRNDNYWSRMATLQRLAFDYTPKANKRLTKLLTDECQVMSMPAASQVSFIRTQPSLSLSEDSGLNTSFIAFNTSKKPLSDLRVRQAISQAINRDNLLQAVFYHTGEWANSLLPPISWGYNPNLEESDYNLQSARNLLKKAGFNDGFDMTLWLQPTTQANNPTMLKTAQLLQSDLQRIGIRVRFVQLRWPLMRSMLQEGRHDALLMNWSADTSDPDNFFRPLLGCQSRNAYGYNFSRWCNPEFERLMAQANRSSQLADRIQSYQQMQSLVQKELPLLPLVHSLNLYVSGKDVHNLETTPVGGIDFKHAYRE